MISRRYYCVWKFVLMSEKDLLEHVQKKPAESVDTAWKFKDTKAMNHIIRCLADLHVDYVRGKGTAFEMMTEIGTKVYLRKS